MSRLIEDLLSLSRIELRAHIPPEGAIADGGLEVDDRAEDARLMRRRVRVEKKSSPKSTGSLHLPSESVHSLAIYRGWQ